MVILYVILGIIAFLLLMAVTLPGRYMIEKTIIIHRPAAEIYNKVANLNYYKEWNPWQKQDPDALATISGEPCHIGHKYHWNGKKVGEGHLTIRSTAHDKAVNFDLQFNKPWKTQAMDAWDFTETSNGTRTVWRNTGELPFPIGRLLGPFLNKQLCKQFEAGLKSLKEVCEK